MRRFLLVAINLLLALSSVAFAADFISSGDSKIFDIQFMKEGIIEYGFGSDSSSRPPYITFQTSTDNPTSTSFDFNYINTYDDPRPLLITFDSNELYDIAVEGSSVSSSGYMLVSAEGNGLNYGVEFSSAVANGNINVADSAAKMDLEARQREITPGKYSVSLTLNPPAETKRFLSGQYVGYIMLVYQED